MIRSSFLNTRLSRRAFGLRALSSAAVIGSLGACSTASSLLSDAPSQTRSIGLDLWVGTAVDPDAAPFNVSSGSRVKYGPDIWTHPITGQSMETFVRVNNERNGQRIQRFAIRSDGQALARVFDQRPGQPDRHFVGDAFFPLGIWSKGENRIYQMTQYRLGQAETFNATLRIRRLSFRYRNVPESLRYDWQLHDQAGRKIFDERFEYSPGIGFVNFTNRM